MKNSDFPHAPDPAEYVELAQRLGTDDPAVVWDFIMTLPYSKLPEAFDGHQVLEWLEDMGWSRG